MTGTTKIAGTTVNCQCVGIREMRIGPDVVKKIYSIIVCGQLQMVDNFTEAAR
jgi:hypothetical protein